jgi:hypothetical protein
MVENTLPEGQSVLLIIGMHRSGLSLFANQCGSLDIDGGSQLIKGRALE